MLKIISSSRFEKDLATAIKRGWDLQALKEVVTMLANQQLDEKYKDHALKGIYSKYRECHVKNDRILIYRVEQDLLELYLFRPGTHSDLF